MEIFCDSNNYDKNQMCRYCLDPASILTPETCCIGCSKLNSTVRENRTTED